MKKRTGVWTTVLLAALLLGLCAESARGQTAAERQLSAQCQLCHGDREVLARRVPAGYHADSLFVSSAMLQASAHGAVPCVRCHIIPGDRPHPDRKSVV